MEYLTTHDLVWINHSLTGKVNPYNYVTLEAAMAGQYRYGDSHDIVGQAATLLRRLLDTKPFQDGNYRTAFIALFSFLNANGYATRLDDAAAAALLREVVAGRKSAAEAVAELAAPASSALPGTLTLRKLITHECNLHAAALQLLTEGDE